MESILNYFKGDSVDSIMSSFTKTIDRLNALSAANMNRMYDNQDAIKSLEAETNELKSEIERAGKIRENLTALLK